MNPVRVVPARNTSSATVGSTDITASHEQQQAVPVVAAVLQDESGRFLLSQRPEGKVRAGEWEFPGGKLLQGESSHEGLCRELQEELGIEVLAAEHLHSFTHHYPDLTIRLHVARVLRWRHAPRAREQQHLDWFDAGVLPQSPLSAADAGIARLLQLPPLLYITPAVADSKQQQQLLASVDKALQLGAGLVYLRQPLLQPEQSLPLLQQISARCHQRAAGIVCNSELIALSQRQNSKLAVDGRHLRAAELSAAGCDDDLSDWRRQHPQALLGASCHDRNELRQAQQAGCDYALLGAVKPSASHPGRAALGWRQLQTLSETTAMPLYACGGLQPADLDQARAHGAYGIAGIRGFAASTSRW